MASRVLEHSLEGHCGELTTARQHVDVAVQNCALGAVPESFRDGAKIHVAEQVSSGGVAEVMELVFDTSASFIMSRKLSRSVLGLSGVPMVVGKTSSKSRQRLLFNFSQ